MASRTDRVKEYVVYHYAYDVVHMLQMPFLMEQNGCPHLIHISYVTVELYVEAVAYCTARGISPQRLGVHYSLALTEYVYIKLGVRAIYSLLVSFWMLETFFAMFLEQLGNMFCKYANNSAVT